MGLRHCAICKSRVRVTPGVVVCGVDGANIIRHGPCPLGIFTTVDEPILDTPSCLYPRLARALDAQDMPTIEAIRVEAGDKFDGLIKQAIGPKGCSGCRKRREWWTAQGNGG